MNFTSKDNPGLRDEITSICRETAKSLDMERSGSRWKCEVTSTAISGQGVKRYSFYVHDKNTGREYQAEARIENGETAEWHLEELRG